MNLFKKIIQNNLRIIYPKDHKRLLIFKFYNKNQNNKKQKNAKLEILNRNPK